MDELEVWLPVIGHEGIYEVSNHGRVMALFDAPNGQYKSGRLLKPTLQNRRGGYFMVSLYRPGTKQWGKCYAIHRLVMGAFVGTRPPGKVCRHLNGVATDNTLINLKWGTVKENSQDSKEHGSMICGEKSNLSKLSGEKVVQIRSMFDNGIGTDVIASTFNIHRGHAWNIGRRKTWKHIPES